MSRDITPEGAAIVLLLLVFAIALAFTLIISIFAIGAGSVIALVQLLTGPAS